MRITLAFAAFVALSFPPIYALAFPKVPNPLPNNVRKAASNAVNQASERFKKPVESIQRDIKDVEKHFDGLGQPKAIRPVDQLFAPKGHENRKPAVVLYWDADRKGACVPLYVGEDFDDFTKILCNDGNDNFNDKASSLEILADARITLYEDIDYKGKSVSFEGKQLVKQLKVNDKYSSCRVTRIE